MIVLSDTSLLFKAAMLYGKSSLLLCFMSARASSLLEEHDALIASSETFKLIGPVQLETLLVRDLRVLNRNVIRHVL